MALLLTGGTGFIGSHAAVEFIKAGYAEFYADASKADRVLHWRTEKTIEDMCRDSWNWEQKGTAKR